VNRTAAAQASVDGDLSNAQVESHHAVQVMVVLACCEGLKSLQLDGNKLGEGGARLISLGLACNSSLTELSLARNSIGAQGAKRLARAISEGSGLGLRKLDVSNQRREIGAGLESLVGAVLKRRVHAMTGSHSCAVEELDLSGSPIGSISVNMVLASLKQHGSTIRDKGFKAVAPLRVIARDSGIVDPATIKGIQAAAKEAGTSWTSD
jgi:hypothetical protein